MEKVVLPHFNLPTDMPSVVQTKRFDGSGTSSDLSKLDPGEFLTRFHHLLPPSDPLWVLGLIGTTVICMAVSAIGIAFHSAKIIADCIALQLQDGDDEEGRDTFPIP